MDIDEEEMNELDNTSLNRSRGRPKAASANPKRFAIKMAEKGIGCYCKGVKSMSQCQDNKWREKRVKPEGPRFFHAEASQKSGSPHLCCKLGYFRFDWKGFSYSRQDDLSRCMQEFREVPSDSCCRLGGGSGSFGVRISKAKSEIEINYDVWQDYDRNHSSAEVWKHEFGKTAPEITTEDITGGEYPDGQEVPVEDLRKLVLARLKAKAGRKLQCGGKDGSFDKLFADKRACKFIPKASERGAWRMF